MKRFFIAIFILCAVLIPHKIYADELDDITTELNKLTSSLTSSKDATKPLENDLSELNKQLSSIKLRLNTIEQSVVAKEQLLQKAESALVVQKKILDARIESHYKNIKKTENSLLTLLVADNLTNSLGGFFYQKKVADRDKQTILQILMHIDGVEKQKKDLEQENTKLTGVKKIVDEKTEFLQTEVTKAKKYQSELSQKIASLSSRQQQLIAQKLASLNIPRSAGTSSRGCSSDLTNGKDPGFSPRFGFFTYGAPHRKGMNQYGALGRAKAGQNEEQILSEYYPGMTLKKDWDQGTQINVEGYGTFTIEDYVKRIYEVPDSWTDNNSAVLKAQAVAARTYALNTIQRRGSICTTEACQVFKPDPKGGNWETAVNATAGWVLIDGGNPGFTQYASTHGGYILNLSKFDGAGGNPTNFQELNSRAYDRESPWFYCNWGSRSQYANTAWIKGDEVADIANVILLARYSDVDKEHLYQTDKGNPSGKDTWDAGKVKSELKSRGGNPIENASSVSVSVDFSSGQTTSVQIDGFSFSGSEFKDWFNVRAPSNIQIVGPLFNIERN